MGAFFRRLVALFRGGRLERDLEDELAFHLAMRQQDQARQGTAPHEAEARAYRQFGNVLRVKERSRDAWAFGWLESVLQDVRFAIRGLCRAPGFTVVAVLTLGLGIGANTAIFDIFTAVLLRPMPVADPDRLVMLTRGQAGAFSYPGYKELQSHATTLSGLTASLPMESDLDVNGESEFVVAEVISANYAAVLGVTPTIGRWFTDEREPAVVISDAVWQGRFARSPDVIGRQIQSESQSYTIVAVAPRDFSGVFAPMRTDIWVPIRTRPNLATQLDSRRPFRMMMLFGRLRTSVTTAQVTTELNAIDAQLEPDAEAGSRVPVAANAVRGLPSPGFRRAARTGVALLTVVVALILMIACVNVANLLLARGALRERELSIRRALGASRSRLLRQLLTESLVLATGAGVCGLILAVWTNNLLERLLSSLPSVFPRQLDLSWTWSTASFAAALSFGATVVFGLLPAWRTSKDVPQVKSAIGGWTPRRRPVALVAQVAISLGLLFLAGSFLEALLRLQATDPGFAVNRRLYAYTFLPGQGDSREFYSRALDRLRNTPSIRNVTLTDSLPLMPVASNCAAVSTREQVPVTTSAVDRGYFVTMGIGLLSGRDFDVDEFQEGSPAVVISVSLAQRLWPNGQVLGERILLGCDKAEPRIVVGVVRDVAVRTLSEPKQPHVYRPYNHSATRLLAVLLETTAEPNELVESVRGTLLGLGQGFRVYAVQPLSGHVQQSYAEARWQAFVLTGFGLLALLLAAIGLCGVIAYRVSLSTQEIGVRMALGASQATVFREVVTQGLIIVLIGVVTSEILTLGLTRVAGALQTGIRPTSVSMHLATVLIWIVVSVVACYVPARRAANVDPLVALRCE